MSIWTRYAPLFFMGGSLTVNNVLLQVRNLGLGAWYIYSLGENRPLDSNSTQITYLSLATMVYQLLEVFHNTSFYVVAQTVYCCPYISEIHVRHHLKAVPVTNDKSLDSYISQSRQYMLFYVNDFR